MSIFRRGIAKLASGAVYRVVSSKAFRLETIGGMCPRTLVLSQLDASSKVISGGVGGDISFELQLAELKSCQIALFDPSPTGARTIESLSPLPPPISFYPIGISAESGMRLFAAPFNPGEGSFREPATGELGTQEWSSTSVHDFMRQNGWPVVDLIKLDIEGFEYEVLRSLLHARVSPRQLLVEFHYGQTNGHSFWEYLAALLALRSRGYKLIHRRYDDHTFALDVH